MNQAMEIIRTKINKVLQLLTTNILFDLCNNSFKESSLFMSETIQLSG
jgi:hypothetical protein